MFQVSSDINDFITGLVKMFVNNVVDLCFSMNIQKKKKRKKRNDS